jgi:hypothetical protein
LFKTNLGGNERFFSGDSLMSVNLNQAARLAGKSKNTLLRAITSGKLTERRNDNGTYAFDEAELAKVFPPTGPGTDILEMEIEGVRALLEEVKAQRDDLLKERDAWRAQAERLAAAMPTRE